MLSACCDIEGPSPLALAANTIWSLDGFDRGYCKRLVLAAYKQLLNRQDPHWSLDPNDPAHLTTAARIILDRVHIFVPVLVMGPGGGDESVLWAPRLEAAIIIANPTTLPLSGEESAP